MAIEDFFSVAVTVKTKGTTVSRFGIKTPGADVVVFGRLQETTNLTVEIAGREQSVDAIFYAPADSGIKAQDRIVTPLNVGEEMEVIRVKRTRRLDGTVHHLKVELGRTQRGRVS